MKIVIISTIRNEEDIIEAFVRYHLQFADRMMVIDHRSIDSSGYILEQLRKEGLPVEIYKETSLDLQQGQFLTKLMRIAVSKFDADWVIPLDADEFLAPSDHGHVLEILERLPRNKVAKIRWRTYLPLLSDDENEINIIRRIRNYRIHEPISLRKIAVPRVFAEKKNVIIDNGNHGLTSQVLWRKKQCVYENADELVLAHYPVRSKDQVRIKAFVGWLACLAKPNKLPTENYHLKMMFDRFTQGNSLSMNDLSCLAFGYATQDSTSIPRDSDVAFKPLDGSSHSLSLRYFVNKPSLDPLALLAKLSEELAATLAQIRRKRLR